LNFAIIASYLRCLVSVSFLALATSPRCISDGDVRFWKIRNLL
jgi:hypothetical protein